MNRGFDEFYGFMGRGAHPYFDHSDMSHPIYRGLTPIKEEGYLTTRITEEAVDFIGRHKDEPFFLYVAYNAVHAPPEAPEEDIKQVTGDETRDTLMAMIKHLDMGGRRAGRSPTVRRTAARGLLWRAIAVGRCARTVGSVTVCYDKFQSTLKMRLPELEQHQKANVVVTRQRSRPCSTSTSSS